MAEGGTDRAMSEIESSLYSLHSQNNVEQVGVEICTIMTRLGYGELMRWLRVEKYMEYDRLFNARRSDLTRITTGSKAEGLTRYLENDLDMLDVLNGVLCVEAGISLDSIPDDIQVYKMDTRVYPGHCILFLEREAPIRNTAIHNALCDYGLLLSSALFVDECYKLNHSSMEYHERAGPSIPMSIANVCHIDIVFALRCQCPSILNRWAAKRRRWPSAVIVQKVVSLGAYVTPVGFRGSECKLMEWRICFPTGERELANNLNDTQTKVYVLLKMIVKDVLMPPKKEITSYVIRNIVFWQAESNPRKKFVARSLFHWLHEGLRQLRTVIATQKLPHFIISDRNLMAACGLEDALQHKWVADITDMLADGPRFILRLPKIRQAIVGSPEPMLWFSNRRMQLEMLSLEMRNRAVQCRDENGVVDESDAILLKIKIRQGEIVMEVRQRTRKEGCAVNDLSAIREMMLM